MPWIRGTRIPWDLGWAACVVFLHLKQIESSSVPPWLNFDQEIAPLTKANNWAATRMLLGIANPDGSVQPPLDPRREA